MNILDARAQPMPTDFFPERNIARQYLTFTLGTELFAVPITPVREILEFRDLTPVPLAPACVRGVLNLRGAVVPIIDLSAHCNRAAALVGPRTCIVIVETETGDGPYQFGVIVDAVNEVLEADAMQIRAKPDFGADLRADFVAGILNIADRFVVILDMPRVFSAIEPAAINRPTEDMRESQPMLPNCLSYPDHPQACQSGRMQEHVLLDLPQSGGFKAAVRLP